MRRFLSENIDEDFRDELKILSVRLGNKTNIKTIKTKAGKPITQKRKRYHGFGYVEFQSNESASAFIERYNEKFEYEGCPLTLEMKMEHAEEVGRQREELRETVVQEMLPAGSGTVAKVIFNPDNESSHPEVDVPKLKSLYLLSLQLSTQRSPLV